MRRYPVPTVLRAVALILPLLAALAAPVHAEPTPLEGLDRYIESAMAEWKVPGRSIAVVHDGRVAWARGFGVRSLDASEPVDENTLFAIGSASNAFTTASLGMLVQEGLVGWDDRATDHLPRVGDVP